MFAVFIQGPGPSLRFLAIRPTREHAEGVLRAFADRLAQDDPHRDVNAFVVPCDYFYLHGGQLDRVPAIPASDINFPVLDRFAVAEMAQSSAPCSTEKADRAPTRPLED